MDKLITAIQTTDVNSEKDLKNLRSTLQKAEEVLFKHLPHLDEALSILDPKIHTLGWMYILYVYANLINGYNGHFAHVGNLQGGEIDRRCR